MVRGDQKNVGSSKPGYRVDHRNTIHETARGDPDALAERIIAALDKAGSPFTAREPILRPVGNVRDRSSSCRFLA
jgi:hypothetical protein